jgi:hypothetical protein
MPKMGGEFWNTPERTFTEEERYLADHRLVSTIGTEGVLNRLGWKTQPNGKVVYIGREE